jgi:histidinol dehydrogenase
MLSELSKENPQQLADYLLSRSQDLSSEVLTAANNIIFEVRKNKDAALKAYTKQFDGIELDDLKVGEEELEEKIAQVDPAFKKAMEQAKENIVHFHEAQKQDGYQINKEDDVYLGQRVLPLDAVGIYVPGGRAQYPSSVLMNAIPAHVAGVKRIVMVTPPDKQGSIHPNIAYAAKLAGVSEIYKVGGAQAVAALAYGTESIAPVDKIVGPGNIFVAAAKKLVFGKVDIDMIAGPSEILVIADDGANPEYVAADLLSQAEHDPMASAILLATSQKLINEVNAELTRQSALLPKKEIVEKSLKNFGKSILCDSLEEAVEFANQIAPEHLELQVEKPEELLPLVKNAGSVFMGYYTCESIGDYFGGVNHVLPTNATARFSSALSVDSFIKKSSYLHYSKPALEKCAAQIVTMAKEEELQAHANAVSVRVKA